MLWLVKLIILKKFVASLIKKLIVDDIPNMIKALARNSVPCRVVEWNSF